MAFRFTGDLSENVCLCGDWCVCAYVYVFEYVVFSGSEWHQLTERSNGMRPNELWIMRSEGLE